MKKFAFAACVALAACSSPKPPAETVVAFTANGAEVATAPGPEETVTPSANYVKPTGALTIYFFGAVAPDKTRRQFSIQVTGFKGGTGKVHVAAAVFDRKDAEGRAYEYAAKGDALHVEISEFELDDVKGSPLQEGWVSGTFEGEMPYVYPKKDGNPFTESLWVKGKFTGIRVAGTK